MSSKQTSIWYPAIGMIFGALIGLAFSIAFSALTGRPFMPLWIAICAPGGLILGLALRDRFGGE